jgi:hypothetical protein
MEQSLSWENQESLKNLRIFHGTVGFITGTYPEPAESSPYHTIL